MRNIILLSLACVSVSAQAAPTAQAKLDFVFQADELDYGDWVRGGSISFDSLPLASSSFGDGSTVSAVKERKRGSDDFWRLHETSISYTSQLTGAGGALWESGTDWQYVGRITSDDVGGTAAGAVARISLDVSGDAHALVSYEMMFMTQSLYEYEPDGPVYSFANFSKALRGGSWSDEFALWGEITSEADIFVRNVRIETMSPGAAAIPEPATWAMMIAGFGLVGGMARRRQAASTAAR